jgi:hypothetical protein
MREMSTSVTNFGKLAGRVAVVTASTDGWVRVEFRH